MLGKGLESLIPPVNNNSGEGNSGQSNYNSDDKNIQDTQRGDDLRGEHEHVAPFGSEQSEPQILSFNFDENEENKESEDLIDKSKEGFKEEDNFQTDKSHSSEYYSEHEEQGNKDSSIKNEVSHSRVVYNEPVEGHVFNIEISKVSPNRHQPRKNFNEEGIVELARSIREFGFLQPLVVSRKEVETVQGIDVEYELIAGERRLMAAKKLGLEHVPAIVRNVDLELEKLELAVIENIQREDLDPIERARAFQRLQEEFRMTQREIAAKLGKSRETVANAVRLLDLPAYVQDALGKGGVSESHGRLLLQIEDPSAQKKLFEDIVSRGLTTREVKNRVERTKPESNRKKESLSPEFRMIEDKLTAELGTPVKIERSGDTGKIMITFYSDEELQHILNIFGGTD